MISLTLTVILISLFSTSSCEFLFDSLRERLLGRIEVDLTEAKWMFLTALIIARNAEIVVDAAFDRLL